MHPLAISPTLSLDGLPYTGPSPDNPLIPFSTCYAACLAGDLQKVKSYLTLDPSLISQFDTEGQTLLYACAAANQLELIQWMYEQNPLALKIVRPDDQTLMHIAALQGHLEIVQWLHEKDPSLIEKADKNQLTPLHQAAFHEAIPILKVFIKKLKQNRSLIQKIARENCPKALAYLLEQRIDINTSNNFQQTLLHLAAQAGQETNVLCLLQHGAKIDALDRSGKTPLFLAVMQNHRAIVKLLMRNKADPTITSIEQETPLHAAALYGHTQILSDLLAHPFCKYLIDAKNQDGKTPLHKAMWGPPKPDVVTLLIAHGADVNALNHDGYTPLHWAAKYGHTDSAKILLTKGARIDLVNANRDLPFDLAIRFGQDDFIHFILQTSQRMEKHEIWVEDLEGHHYKLLLAAKKEGLLEEQILHLQIISYHYIKKKKFITGAKVLNCALALLYQLPAYPHADHLSLFERYLLYRLEQIEVLFLASKGLQFLPRSLSGYRNYLKEIRSSACRCIGREISIPDILSTLTTKFKLLLGNLIFDAQQILGPPPPVTWACIGMGSMSRNEMCPYSDVEFAFLVEKETDQAMEYFRTLSQILELRIINLGETKFPIFREHYPSPTPNGFCMDTGGNTPLGVTGIYELIGTPETLAQFQSVKWMERSIILSNAMSHVCLIVGHKSLMADYIEQKKQVQELVDKQFKALEKNHKVLALRLLAGHIEEFSPNLSDEKEKINAFGIKKELYRPFQEIIASLALFYQLEAKTTLTRIDELVSIGVISSEGADNLNKAIVHVLALRLKAHLFYHNEKEFFCHPEEGKSLDPYLMYFTEEYINMLCEIYKVLIPFHRCGKEFLTSKSKNAFNSSTFYDDGLSTQGLAFDTTLHYAKAKETFQQAVSLNPNDLGALLWLGNIEKKIGNSKNALPRTLKALELSRQKYGENHFSTAICYNNMGMIYSNLGDYDKALEYHQKALKIDLQVLDDNHPSVAASYGNIGMVYSDLGDYDKALEYTKKSLKIRLQVLDENHPDMATSYNNIGTVYQNLRNYNQALEYYQKSLKIDLQVLDENHPYVAASCNNIGMVYSDLGEYDKALEYTKKSLKIDLQVLDENHPDVATTYSNIGTIYNKLGEYDQALEYTKKSLKIRLQILGENHPDVATIYSNIGMIYNKLGEYDQALEHSQKALQIRLSALGENHTDVAMSYNNIGCVYQSLEGYGEALDYYQKALKIQLQAFGENHPDVAMSYNNIGEVYSRAKNLRNYKALEYHQQALKIRLQVLGENHPDVAITYSNIGALYYKREDYDKAMDYFRISFTIWCRTYKQAHPTILVALKNIISIAKKLQPFQKNLGKIDSLSGEVNSLCMQILGEEHELLIHELFQKPFKCKPLGEIYSLCVQTLGKEHELTQELFQLIEHWCDSLSCIDLVT